MAKPPLNVGWPMVPVLEDPYVGVEIGPNEIVHVVMRVRYDELVKTSEQLWIEHARLREAAQAQIEAANAAIDLWKHYGHRHE